MPKSFDSWIGLLILEFIILAFALMFFEGMKLVIFLITVIAATLIVGSTSLLLKKESSESSSKTDI